MNVFKKTILNKVWWLAALMRALKAGAAAALGLIGTSVLITDVSWVIVASATGMAAVVSLITSLAGLPEVSDEEIEDAIEEEAEAE